MDESGKKRVPIYCVSCGCSDTDSDGRLRTDLRWLRRDDELGLGVCADCALWVAAWDRGQRDVRMDASEGGGAMGSAAGRLGLLVENASLPSLSHVLLEIYDLLSSETAGADQIAQLIATNAALSARTLRLANSAYYGLSRKISQIPEALSRIGPFDLWWLLLSTEVKSLFFGIDQELMDMSRFWRHSLLVACNSRILSQRLGMERPAEMFVAGLLHDIGKLLLLQRIPVDYGAVLTEASREDSLVELEQRMLGFTHAEAGGLLLDRWRLPAVLIDQVQGHHAVCRSITAQNLVAAANQLAHWMREPGDAPAPPAWIKDETVTAASEALYGRLAALII